MEQVVLEVESRQEQGSGPVGRLRRDGWIPGVVYGQGGEVSMLKVSESEYRKWIAGGSGVQIYKLKSSDKKLDGVVSLVKDVQHEPLKDRILHLDFLSLTEGDKVTVSVGVELVGESQVIKQGQAVLNQTLYEVEVLCSLENIPSGLTLDISELTEGHSLHASDIELPKEVELKTDPRLSVATAVAKTAEAEPEPQAEAVAGTDAAAPAPEGDAESAKSAE